MNRFRIPFVALLALFCVQSSARSEVILQYFETEWEEIYRRMPEISEIGYSGIWHPSPAKSPVSGGMFAGGGNVGYSLFDRFDVGDIPQRGARATRYGSRGALRKMVDAAHQADVKIYPDIVMNHAGNGPNFWTYPGMRPNDFHGWWDGNQPGGFRRAERMNAWGDVSNGFGLTFQQELVSLIDIVTERDNRFSNSRGYARPDVFVRHPGRYDLYPFHNPGQTLPAEHPVDFLNRWIVWLGDAMDYDGARFDAPKHVIADFFGRPGEGGTFNHELQFSYKSRRGFNNYANVDQLYQNDLRRRDSALIFSEFFIGGQGEIDYWRNYGNKFRYIDFPRKSSMIWPAFNDGNLAALSSFAGFSPAEGVMFIESHDESPPFRRELGYAYILTRVGVPIVYTTGNNLANNESKVNTWMFPGYPGALGDFSLNRIPNLVYISNNFARGNEWERWSEGNFYAFERYEGPIRTTPPVAGEGLLLVALSTSNGNNSRTVQTAFQPGTVLKDYTGNAGNITVGNDGRVNVTVPASVQGGGYVAYAPVVAEGPTTSEAIRFAANGNPVGNMNWVVPGGRLAADKPRQLPRITTDTVDIDVHFTTPSGVTVDSVMIKWGEGDIAPNRDTTAQFYNPAYGIVSGGFQRATQIAPGHWRLTADVSQFPEGLNTIKARVFNQRASGLPALFQTFTKAIYVDRRGPDLQIVGLNDGATVRGAPMVRVENPDRLAAAVEFSVDGTNWTSADRVMAGVWQFAMPPVPAGARTLSVRAGEYDWGTTRTRINESIVTRNLTVEASPLPLAINFNGHVRPNAPANEIHMPFFRVNVVADESVSAANVKLFWNEFEMVGLNKSGANFSTTFDGRFRLGTEEQRLWGSFVNGPHVFRAEVTHNGQTYHVSRRVVFNLYGQNLIDSDGDGLPDNVEMEFFDTGTNPGYGRSWPGDSNEDMIPNFGERWTRLNPLNHDTTYSNTWDGQEDWSGDGYSNLYKVRRGYWDTGNAYQYSIYSSHSGQLGNEAGFDFGGAGDPGDGGNLQPGNPSSATISPGTPDNTEGGATVTITYTPGEGVLAGADKVFVHLGFNGWQVDVRGREMTESNGVWTYSFTLPDEAFLINFVFRNEEATVWDNNSSQDWTTTVIPLGGVGGGFVMDGRLDSDFYEIGEYQGMKLWAAVRGTTLYVATWGTGGGSNDHFIYLNDNLGDATEPAWGKAGWVFLGPDMIFLAGEGDSSGNNFSGWFGAQGVTDTANAKGNGAENYLEGTIDLLVNFGMVPEAVYLAVGAYQSPDVGALVGQVPAAWDTNNNLEVTEFLRVPIHSIRDENGDGYFDGGNPQMWTVVNENEQDANYGLRRFFLDEIRGEQEWMTVLVEPRTGRDGQIAEIEVFTNLNRRDFAKLPGDEDPDQVTSTSLDTYYLGHPMQSAGAGRWSVTLPVYKCGAYRLNARWRFAGSDQWHYYTDNGLRRDTAVVVTPKKALDTILYELNPLTAESKAPTQGQPDAFDDRSTFRDMIGDSPGRPNRINPDNLASLGINMIWLQPVHPIGLIGREVDPLTSQDYDPGSPYAVRNYWEVNPVLGQSNTAEGALQEFIDFVEAYEAKGIGIMLDGTFNHSAWDAEIGVMATRLNLRRPDGGVINPWQRISEVRPGWYSKKGSYGEPATFFVSMTNNDIAEAPDRIDFGKWGDAADFFFGRYDALVQGPVTEGLEGAWFSEWFQRYLREDDNLEPLSPQTKELWEYFANYSLFWLEKTGLTGGESLEEQAASGIAGLRCDFAQGLPNEFWEYTINKTRSVKWDFLFMAESLDGNRVIDGSPRHGVGYRSARHFDILNENMVFLWRDQFFNYRTFPDQATSTPNRSTGLLWQAFDQRKNAFELSPILLNLTSHDEIFPTDDQWSLLYAYAIVNAMDGVPMIFYGQEMGAQNNILEYGGRSDHGIGAENNFSLYETNFGKSIPNFKRYNSMTKVWSPATWKTSLLNTYSRLNQARLGSPALRSQQNYFLDDNTTNGWNNDIFAVAKFQVPGVSAAEQDVVFVFVNNDFRSNDARGAVFKLNAVTESGANWFGIQPTHRYNVVDLASDNPTRTLWDNVTPGNPGILGSTLIANGIFVGFQPADTFSGGQAQYLRLIDMTAGMTGESANDYSANPQRLPAPVIAPIGDRAVAVGEALNVVLNVTVAPGDTVLLSAASSLAPVNWTFNSSGQFTFTPTANEEGTHVFRFTATGQDGTTEQTITVSVTSGSTLAAYENWARDIWGVAPGAALPAEAAPDADPDGDRNSNLAEFHLGTDPRDPNDRLTVKIVGMGENSATLHVNPVVEAGTFYIQETQSLNGEWSTPQPMSVEGAVETGEINHPVNGIQTFFRVIYQPPTQP
jgi:glycosidase